MTTMTSVSSPFFLLETPPSPPGIVAVSVEHGYRVIPRNLLSAFDSSGSSLNLNAPSIKNTAVSSPSFLLVTPPTPPRVVAVSVEGGYRVIHQNLLSAFNDSASSASSSGESFSHRRRRNFIESVLRRSKLRLGKWRERERNLKLDQKRKIRILMSMRIIMLPKAMDIAAANAPEFQRCFWSLMNGSGSSLK